MRRQLGVPDESVIPRQAVADHGLGARMCVWAFGACTAIAVIGFTGLLLISALTPHLDSAAGLGFAGGVGVAAVSFAFSSLVIAWADLVDRRLILPVGLLTYVLKIVTIGLVVFALARHDWPGFEPLLWGIAVGTATWVSTQAVWAYRWAARQGTIPPG